MTLRDAAGLSASTLRKDPIRTLLTVLGLGVGVAAILTVLTLGGAGQTQVEAEIARLGVDKVWIAAAGDSDRALTAADGPAVAQTVAAPVCAGAATLAILSAGEDALAGRVLGYDDGFEAVHAPALAEGRLFSAREYAEGAAVAVVDASLAEAMGGDAVGRRLRVGARWVRVVGVVKDQAAAATGAAGTAMLPLRTFMDTFADAAVAELTVTVPAGARADEIGALAAETLAARGGRFTHTSLQEEIDAAKAVIRIFVMVLACVAAVCMLTGAIGVMNILLVSVRERRREIGLIKAIGGTARQVALLFLLEAAGYALLGGVTGLALGAVLVKLFGAWIGLSAVIHVPTAAMVLGASALLGALFGVLPAMRAAGMQPVDALKGE